MNQKAKQRNDTPYDDSTWKYIMYKLKNIHVKPFSHYYYQLLNLNKPSYNFLAVIDCCQNHEISLSKQD